MPTDIRNLDFTISDDATFRAAATAIHNVLTAIGLVQTADTGQINLATVSRPAANTAAGYEIWRMDDADQATHPIFVKVEYGCGSVNTRHGLWTTFGTGSNGSGTLTNAGTRTQVNPSVTSSGISYASANDGGFLLSGCMHANGANFFFGAQRTRDADTGVQKANIVWTAGLGLTMNGQVWNPNTLTWTTGGSLQCWIPLGEPPHIGGNATDVAMCPGLVYNGKLDYFSWLCADNDDVTLGTPFTIDMPEGSRTFMPLDATYAPHPSYAGVAQDILCIPWE